MLLRIIRIIILGIDKTIKFTTNIYIYISKNNVELFHVICILSSYNFVKKKKL